MAFENSLKRGVFFGFVPHRLEIPDKPELNFFPYNVLFVQYKEENGRTISGSAVYEPDFGSYKRQGNTCSMEYRNRYGVENWLLIEYNYTTQRYQGTKMINGQSVGMAFGSRWNMFFVHFTSLGLTNGEKCKFEDLSLINKIN